MSVAKQQLLCLKTPSACRGDYSAVPWDDLPLSSPFVHSHGKGGTCYLTQVQTAWDGEFLYIRFHCADDEILATMTERDQPLYDEEVVEVFIAPVSPSQYYEFNLSPRNVVFDSLIEHDGINFTGHSTWDCPQLVHGVYRRNSANHNFGDWDGYLAIPFACLNITPAPGQSLGINFFRIKRLPQDQYLAWSPTGRDPAAFHIPDRFGVLVLTEP